MSQRTVIGLIALLALGVTACEFHYTLQLRADGSGAVQAEMIYSPDLISDTEDAMRILKDQVDPEIDGVTVVEEQTDDSDPEEHRVAVLLEADDPEAVDALIESRFRGFYTHQGNDRFEVVLRRPTGVPSGAFGSGTIRHDGERIVLEGEAEVVDDQTLRWDPFDSDEPLRLVLDFADGDGNDEDASDGGFGRLPWILLGMVVLVAIGALVFLLLRRGGDEQQPTPETEPSHHGADPPPPPTDAR